MIPSQSGHAKRNFTIKWCKAALHLVHGCLAPGARLPYTGARQPCSGFKADLPLVQAKLAILDRCTLRVLTDWEL